MAQLVMAFATKAGDVSSTPGIHRGDSSKLFSGLHALKP